MANMGSSTSGQPLDLNRLYGIDENMASSQPNTEELIGYNLNPSSWNTTENNAPRNSATNQNTQQSSASMYDVGTRNSTQNPMQPQPQRQEQTFPTNREPLENAQVSSEATQGSNAQRENDMRSFLQRQVGQNVTIQFLVGTNSLVEQTGTLVGVGENYIVLRETNTGKLLVCNFDDIKFVKIEGR